MNLIDAGSERTEPNPYLDSSPGKKVGATVFATLTVLAIYEALFYFRQWKDSLQASERLKKEHTISQLEALRSQVNPHFLFNSLNTLASLIPEDPKRAVGFVQELSKVYRNVLEQKEQQVITLEEELNHLQSYLFLAGQRFGESLQITIEVAPENRRLFIVPLSLQILAENAIKHNIVSRNKPLIIEIHASPGHISVRNNLQSKSGKLEGTGTGLQNIRERFRLTFGKDIDVSQTDTSFMVTLPLVLIDEL
jgi:LytS/YehU family sensor histidine kinase